MTGRNFGGQKAAEMGFINMSFPLKDLEAENSHFPADNRRNGAVSRIGTMFKKRGEAYDPSFPTALSAVG